MCKASILAEKFRDGEEDEELGIYTGPHGLGTFYSLIDKPGECAVCYKTGTRMKLEDIPPKLQKIFGIDATESVIFLETEGSAIRVVHDLFYFENHPSLKPVEVACFADYGVYITVTYVPYSDISVEDVLGRPIDEAEAGESQAEILERHAENCAA